MVDPTKGTQSQQILDWMEAGLRISPVEALNEFGCFRLAARISDLRSEGYEIQSEMVSHINQAGNTIRFKVYWMEDVFHLEAM